MVEREKIAKQKVTLQEFSQLLGYEFDDTTHGCIRLTKGASPDQEEKILVHIIISVMNDGPLQLVYASSP